MNIIEAAQAMSEGKKIRRKAWSQGKQWIQDDCIWYQGTEDSSPDYDDWMPSLADLLATDWEVMNVV